ncbi:MAG: hypothetical protein JXA66_08890 [Oligoflexia bacterium]|nr:hypothetical protein [Oligoflexia bacterium]
MKTHCLLFLIFFFVYSEPAIPSNQECKFNEIEFSENHFMCLKSHVATKSIRKNLVEYKSLRKECPECREPFMNANKYSYLYDQNYMSLAISVQGFGGYYLYVIFNNDSHVYQLWLYPIDDGNYQLREISREMERSKISGKLNELNKFTDYWLSAS